MTGRGRSGERVEPSPDYIPGLFKIADPESPVIKTASPEERSPAKVELAVATKDK
jgi:hypothetical protein